MFDLYAGVHLDEVERAVLVEELESAGATVTNIDAGFDAAGEDFLACLLVDARCWRFFENFLVAALQRTVAVTQVDGVALTVGKHLNFHVAWIGEEFFQIDHRVAERRASFGASQFGRGDQVFFFVYHAHAAATAAASGFDDYRVADFTANRQSSFFVFRQRAVGAGYGRYASGDHGVLGRNLVAHQANGVGFRADKGEAGFLYLLSKVGVFREKTIAWVDGGSASHFGCGNDRWNVQVGLGRWARTNTNGFVS